MMDVKGPNHVGFIGNAGSGDVRIVNRREVNYGFRIGHGLHDLTEVLNVSHQVFDFPAFRTRKAVEHSDFVSSAVEQFAHNPLTHFADAAGNENFHYALFGRAAERVNEKDLPS
jgi:hypothetical protein